MQVRDELRVLVEAEVSRAIENFKKLENGIEGAQDKAGELGEKLDGLGEKDVGKLFQGLQAATERAAASMQLFGASGDELRNVQNQIKEAAVELVSKGIDPESEEVKKLVAEYKRLEKEAGEVDKANGKNINSFDQLKNAVCSLAEVAAALKVLSVIKDMGAFALQTADDFQTMKNQFGVLLGDMEAGAGLFNEIKAFNDKTPFDMSTLTQATNVLIAAKVPLQDLQAQLTKFGDLAQGNSQRMTSYIHAYSIAAAKGKADTQVLNTYLNQGVPILGALAEQFKTTEAEVLSMASNGEIAFADFNKALEELAAEGGVYFGGMELASQSLAAMQEGLKEAVNSLAASFGDMLLPAATAIVGALTELANVINDSPIAKGLFAGALVAIAGYLTAMAVKAGIAFAQQMALNIAVGALNPVVMAATVAAAALAAGYVVMAAQAQKAKKEQEDFALALRQTAGAAREYADAFAGMSAAQIGMSLVDAQRSVSTLERSLEAAKERLNEYQSYRARRDDRYVKELNKRKAAVLELERQLEVANQKLEAQKQAYDAWRNSNHEILPTELPPVKVDGDDSAAKAAAEFRKRWAEEWRRFENQGNPFIDIEIAWDEKKAEAAKYGATDLLDGINEYYQAKWNEAAGQLIEQEQQLAMSLSESKTAALDAQREAELKQLRELETARIISAKKTGEDILQIAETYDALAAQINDKYDKAKDAARLEEARASLVDWQQSLSDTLTLAMLDLEMFGDGAAAVLGDLSAEFANLGIRVCQWVYRKREGAGQRPRRGVRRIRQGRPTVCGGRDVYQPNRNCSHLLPPRRGAWPYGRGGAGGDSAAQADEQRRPWDHFH
jgi:tape measure domain-containing protein